MHELTAQIIYNQLCTPLFPQKMPEGEAVYYAMKIPFDFPAPVSVTEALTTAAPPCAANVVQAALVSDGFGMEASATLTKVGWVNRNRAKHRNTEVQS